MDSPGRRPEARAGLTEVLDSVWPPAPRDAALVSLVLMNAHSPISRLVILRRKQGLHLRVASQVIALVRDFPGEARIRYGEKSADASSMFELIQLIALPDAELEVIAAGDGAQAIVDGIAAVLSRPSDDAPPVE